MKRDLNIFFKIFKNDITKNKKWCEFIEFNDFVDCYYFCNNAWFNFVFVTFI